MPLRLIIGLAQAVNTLLTRWLTQMTSLLLQIAIMRSVIMTGASVSLQRRRSSDANGLLKKILSIIIFVVVGKLDRQRTVVVRWSIHYTASNCHLPPGATSRIRML